MPLLLYMHSHTGVSWDVLWHLGEFMDILRGFQRVVYDFVFIDISMGSFNIHGKSLWPYSLVVS